LIFLRRSESIMLTRPSLCVGPWQTDGKRPVRLVRDPATNAALGLVRMVRPQQWWRFWSAAAALEVCETDDHSLVMSVRPSRISKGIWLVFDCDGNEIGKLRDNEILDPWTNAFARRERDAAGTWALHELAGRGYATCATDSACEDCIAFLEPVLTNPFLRMLVIGSFLLLRPQPTVAC
jgi:hypothetical protein